MQTVMFPGGGLGSVPPGLIGGGFGVARVTPVSFTKTLLYARIFDLEGEPIEGAKIRIESLSSEKVGTYVRATDSITLETNSQGYAEAYVIQGTIVRVTSRSIRKTAFDVVTTGETNINLADYCA